MQDTLISRLTAALHPNLGRPNSIKVLYHCIPIPSHPLNVYYALCHNHTMQVQGKHFIIMCAHFQWQYKSISHICGGNQTINYCRSLNVIIFSDFFLLVVSIIIIIIVMLNIMEEVVQVNSRNAIRLVREKNLLFYICCSKLPVFQNIWTHTLHMPQFQFSPLPCPVFQMPQECVPYDWSI